MASHDNYDKDVLKALQRIANSIEKIEKKIPVKATENKIRELSNCDCSTCKYSDIHLREAPCYSCRDGSNYATKES